MIRTVAETGSTNADILAMAPTWREGDWLRAERQSGGRGRMGRHWSSPAGNLYASSLVRLMPGDPPAPSLALVAGIAAHVAAAGWVGGDGLLLKWPNDLLAGNAKVAGILLERSGDAVVIGIGMNLATAPSLPDRPTASLARLRGAAPPPAAIMDDLARAFAGWLGRWRSEGLAPVRKAWMERAHAVGMVLATGSDPRREGLFDGLDEVGALRLRMANGTVETIHAGDVALI